MLMNKLREDNSMDSDDISAQIDKLQKSYSVRSSDQGRDELYRELLDKYASALEKITGLEQEVAALKSKNTLPSKDEVDAMSSMVDLISKLDEATIEKLNRFGTSK